MTERAPKVAEKDPKSASLFLVYIYQWQREQQETNSGVLMQREMQGMGGVPVMAVTCRNAHMYQG